MTDGATPTRQATPARSGGEVMREIRDLLERRLPEVPEDDPVRPYLAEALTDLREGLARPV